MGKIKDLTLQRFGLLIAVKVVGKDNKNNAMWECNCDCGKTTKVVSRDLANGHTSSCGCKIFKHYKHDAHNAGRVFELDFDTFVSICAGDCHYCGSKASNRRHRGRANGAFFYNGIDRKDNLIGYIPENCVPCCKVCNRAKREMGYLDFITWCDNIAKYRYRSELE
jgi:hypothetical protein